MSTLGWVILAIVIVVALAIIAIVAWSVARKRRTDRLRAEFGPEYDLQAKKMGRGKAESELEQRRKRVEKLNIRPLSGQEAAGYQREWDAVQAHFVDNPSSAINEADDLVGRVMQARGYPVGDFDQRIADISVDHADVANHYRAAHAIAERNRDTKASTEDLRQGMVHYRALFRDLLQTAEVPASGTSGAQSGQPRHA